HREIADEWKESWFAGNASLVRRWANDPSTGIRGRASQGWMFLAVQSSPGLSGAPRPDFQSDRTVILGRLLWKREEVIA
ncbi:MAG: hypothetical protein VX435_03565, partial [Planctomycetota bacterium]|nr:hypothetical protein [Planctomycetota bacterium]